jgi:hypothetical protein
MFMSSSNDPASDGGIYDKKDRASREAEQALNRMQEDLSNEDLVSAQIHRWVANQWLKASK